MSVFFTQVTRSQDLGKKEKLSTIIKKDTFPNIKRDTSIVNLDTLSIKKTDTIVKDSIKPKESLTSLVTHDAEDYTIQDAKKNTLTLYNQAHVTYTDIDLKAGIIIVDYKKNTVYAKGIKDSTGYKQRPVFKQGGQESEQDSILFNFKTKKALVYGVKTVQGEIITYGEKTKRVNDSTIYMRKLRFTTSKKDNPDYYISTKKAKLVPGKKIIVGGSNLVLADVPTPVYLPFAYFPLTDTRTSGFIIPSWGDSNNQGFFLQNGGYYFALSDYFDLTLLGDLYTNGSWGLRADTNYFVRYKFNGNFSVRFENLKQSIQGLSDFSEATNFNIRWSHSQDTKASPNSRFSASVNLGSSTYYRQSLNEFNRSQTQTNNLSSSISYYKKFVGTPFNMNVTATHSQNTNTEAITMTLPSLQVNMDRVYPFVGKGGVKKSPIQKMGFNYNLQGQYQINTTDDEFFTPKMFREAKAGVKHTTGTNTNIKAFKYFTLSPSINYSETWYFDKVNKRFDPDVINSNGTLGNVVTDTISGFNRFNDYNISMSLSTNVYGTFNFKKGRLKAIRHTFRPSVSWGYRPDFATKHNLEVQQSIDPTQELLTYSPYEGGIYGTPSSGVSNSIGIQLNNVLEAKVASKDPDSDEEDKKITILNNLNFNTSYNMAADSLRWSPVNASAGTRLFNDKLALNLNATLDPYQINEEGVKINKFNSNIFRVTNVGLTANYSLSSKDFEKNDEENKEEVNNGNGAQNTPDVFGGNLDRTNAFPNSLNNRQNSKTETKETELYKAKIPWTLNLVYVFNYSKQGLASSISRRNTLMFSGDVELTPKWSVGFSSGYDIEQRGFTNTNLSFSRDLDSWRFNFNWTPFGQYSSYNFFIGVKASVLSDLKWEKNRPRDRVLF